MATESFKINLDPLTSKISALPEKIDRAVFTAVEQQRAPTESWMRRNASWTDRTGNARNGLFTTTKHNRLKSHELIAYHSVPYGIWLEVRWSGRYAIIEPTVTNQGPELMKALESLLRAIS